jgi:hypothetical protein
MSDTTIGCWSHENCKIHEIPLCQRVCWEFASQCDEVYQIYQDGRPCTPDIHVENIPMDTSNDRQDETRKNNKQTGNGNTNPSETIRIGTSNNKRKYNITTTNSTTETDGKNSSFVFVRPGTPPQHNKHVTTNRPKKKWKTLDPIPQQHKQPSDKKRHFPRNIENIKSIQTRDTVDSNRDIPGTSTSIHDTNNRRGNTDTTATSRHHTTPAMAVPSTSSMEQTS